MTRLIRVIAAVAACLATLAGGPLLAAPDASQAFDDAVGEYSTAEEVAFSDDHTNVGGKAYDFAKATLQWFGVPGTVVDSADFVRSASKEGINSVNALTLVAKTVARHVPTRQFEAVIKKLDQRQLLEVAERLHLGRATDLQKTVLKYLIETGPKAAGQAEGGAPSEALATVLVDVMKEACKTCGVAWTGYELAVEAKKAAEMAFDTAATQRMFSEMNKAGWYRLDEFQQYFSGGEILKDEARKALGLMHASQDLPQPTDDQVMEYIFTRYQRWQTEIADRKRDAEVLAELKDTYVGLLSYEKEEMFGTGTEADWATRFAAGYMPLYNEFISYRGNKPWPFGLGQETVRNAVFNVLRDKLRGNLTEEEAAYEMRSYLYEWGWISLEERGEKPDRAPKDDRQAIINRIEERLPNLSADKLGALFENIGIQPSVDFYNCLCTAGYHYYTGPDAGGPCRRIGPLGGVDWSGLDASSWQSCGAAYPLPDGRNLVDAIADSVEARRKQSRP